MKRKDWTAILHAVRSGGTRRNWGKAICRLGERPPIQPPKRDPLGRRVAGVELVRLIGMANRRRSGETLDRVEPRPWPCERTSQRARPKQGGRRSQPNTSDAPAWPRREPR